MQTRLDILTVDEVATELRCDVETVRHLARRGELGAFKVRGRWRFRLADVDAYVAARVADVRAAA
jgi:excisionase family DNA binding protein